MSQPSPARGSQQIPVIVLAGFLGSGKTTLLNHLLHRSGGSRIGAIVNDFGAIEIDAMAVAGGLGDSLGNECLCCAVDISELAVDQRDVVDPEGLLQSRPAGSPSPRNSCGCCSPASIPGSSAADSSRSWTPPSSTAR